VLAARGPSPRVHPAHHALAAASRDRGALVVDAFLLGLVVAVFGGLIAFGRRWSAPLERAPDIHLSLLVLPKYAFFSMSRGFVAYAFSLVFTLAYGTIAARSRRAERVLIPLLDILQSVPVLSFLPGLVIGLVGLFPGSNVGLELACVLAIFTGQVWNMTFAYFASLRAIPAELDEVARLHRFSKWKRFTGLELPSGMIGLVWNSMMSMAGGWFFLTVIESFSLRGEAYRLPGIGSYMNAAIVAHDGVAMGGACVAMVLVIVLVDQILWRPIIAWSQRFKIEEVGTANPPTSFVYNLIRRSRAAEWLRQRLASRSAARRARRPAARVEDGPPAGRGLVVRWAVRGGVAASIAAAVALIGWAAIALVRLLAGLAIGDWLTIVGDLGVTAGRVAGAILLGALWTVPVGLMIGLSPRLSRVCQPVIQVVASFPAPMLYPLLAPALVDFGMPFGVVSLLLMLFGTQWYILFNVVAGASAVPQDLREVAEVNRLRPLDRFRRLYLPGIFPFLLTGMVTAAGGAWNASIVAEWVPVGDQQTLSARGVGATIARAFGANDDARLAGGVLVLCAALLLLHRFVWKPLYRLSSDRYSLNR
jgi:NitT/TauT family transport system permease protein